jgi:ribulose bisphosphate carboxylase small subunit
MMALGFTHTITVFCVGFQSGRAMGYYISPRFLDKLSVHITKNYLNLPGIRVPLILGVHGRKGEGKTFQCELVFDRMGVEVIHVSAGELESPDAGDPARMLRLRYREAAELVRVRGKMAVLMINDIDAGAGRVDEYTQYTVNTQLVNATLMNIADNPTNVQLPGSYEAEPIQRVPIVVTGNDFSTLYQPMIRDGRMEKFFWEPSRDDRVGIVGGIFEVDDLAREDVIRLVDTFPDQAIDFYSALRSRLYDEQIRQFIQDVGLERISRRVVNSKERMPEFRKPDFSLPHLIEMGGQMVQEQKRIQEMRLAEEYNKSLYFNRKLGDTNTPGRKEHSQVGDAQEFFRAYQPTPNGSHSPTPPPPSPSTSTSYAGQPSSNSLAPEMVSEVNRILAQGQRLAIEVVDERRFRTGSWNSYGSFEGDGATALAALESCLDENQRNYVRLVSIDPKNRRRITETIIHRPGEKVGRH